MTSKHDKATMDWLYPETCAHALAKWDKGEGIFSIEMGGIGPGYEQAIQVLIFELIRDQMDRPLPLGDTFGDWGDDTVHRIGESCYGFSGAQVDAARQVAYRALRDGWRKTILTVPNDRLIQVSKLFPHAPNPRKHE